MVQQIGFAIERDGFLIKYDGLCLSRIDAPSDQKEDGKRAGKRKSKLRLPMKPSGHSG